MYPFKNFIQLTITNPLRVDTLIVIAMEPVSRAFLTISLIFAFRTIGNLIANFFQLDAFTRIRCALKLLNAASDIRCVIKNTTDLVKTVFAIVVTVAEEFLVDAPTVGAGFHVRLADLSCLKENKNLETNLRFTK